ncbi:hypothetical protein [Companilactobacillus insicii]|uniref:hypothetical protein n=1 Tax=Companilactobacillus insicii TaxID=1732567 RepID=UPI000F799043|nr:hypothetical protein [Companilactobacillus insicii]
MRKYQYGKDVHRAVSSDEIVKLLIQTGGMTVKSITDILAVNANNKTRSLVKSSLVSSSYLTGITAGRAPRVFYKKGSTLDIDRIMNGMTIGYVMWYLRQRGLFTTSIDIDKDFSLSTYLAYKINEDRHLLLRVKIILFDNNVKSRVEDAIKHNFCPVVVTNFNEREYCYDMLSDVLKNNRILSIVIKQRQNAKYLSSYLVSGKGALSLEDEDVDKFVGALKKLKSINDEEIYEDILAEYKKSKLLKEQHLSSLYPTKVGDSDAGI